MCFLVLFILRAEKGVTSLPQIVVWRPRDKIRASKDNLLSSL